MKTNISKAKRLPKIKTHEGGRAVITNPALELERATMSCMLFENTFYETGSEIADRIELLCSQVSNTEIFNLAIRARSDWNLRHVPLFLLAQIAKKVPKPGFASALAATIQRPDELSEFLSLYWRNGRVSLANQVKLGLRRAFTKFSAEQLSKWNRDAEISLRDVMFLVHPKPIDEAQILAFKQLAANELPAPDTWEVALSAGADKKATWERLLTEKKLGIMAFLMNLRNMDQAKVDHTLIGETLKAINKSRAFPYRFLTAAKHAPWLASELSDAMLQRISEFQKLSGTTYVVVDVSGSMQDPLSSRGDAVRLDAASSIAICAREICEKVRVFTFSGNLVETKSYRGLALGEAIDRSQAHGGTWLGKALDALKANLPVPDRIIVITDEQAHDAVPASWATAGYIVNVAPYRPSLPTAGMGWTRINGWSDRLLDFIFLTETANADVHQSAR